MADPRNPISIPSQHNGNCASDTIQIILYFADGYKEYFRALADYLHTNPHITLPPHPLPKINKIIEYIKTSGIRYLKLGKINAPTLARLPSGKVDKEPETGVTCSKYIGAFLERANNTTSKYWEYSKVAYDSFTHGLVSYVKSLGAPIGLGSAPNVWGSDAITDNTVAMQFFTMTIDNSKFHTFCLLLHNGSWYIGDNMLGFLLPAGYVDRINIERYVIGVTDILIPDSAYYTRKYYWHDMATNTEIVGIAETTRLTTTHMGVYADRYLEHYGASSMVRERLYYNVYPSPHAMPVHAMPVHAMPVRAMPVHAMPVHAMPVYAPAPPFHAPAAPAAPAPVPAAIGGAGGAGGAGVGAGGGVLAVRSAFEMDLPAWARPAAPPPYFDPYSEGKETARIINSLGGGKSKRTKKTRKRKLRRKTYKRRV